MPTAQSAPATGYGYSGASSANPLLVLPYDLVPDSCRDLWVANYGNDNLVMFFGLAAPTAASVQPVPVAP